MAVSQDGFHGTFAHVKRLQLSISRNRLIYIAGTLGTYDHTRDIERHCVVIHHGDRKTPLDAGVHCDRLGSKIHFQILEGITLPHGDETPHVYLVPSADRWSNGAGKRSISQVLWALVHNNQKDWAELCPMVEFVLNSSVSASTGYTPFELNYGYIPQLGQCLCTDMMFVGVKQFAQQALWNVMMAHDAIIASHVMQTHHVNRQRRPCNIYSPGQQGIPVDKEPGPTQG